MKNTKHIQRDFHSVTLGHAPEIGCLRAGGAQGVKNGHVVYLINGDDEQNRMRVKFLS